MKNRIKSCSHPVVIEIGTKSGWGEAVLKSSQKSTIDSWCERCGAIRIWNELGTLSSWIEPTPFKKKPTKRVNKNAPICNRCNDTHEVHSEEKGTSFMCTSCPLPCQNCRVGGNGPYCEDVPCSCNCHLEKKHWQYVKRT